MRLNGSRGDTKHWGPLPVAGIRMGKCSQEVPEKKGMNKTNYFLSQIPSYFLVIFYQNIEGSNLPILRWPNGFICIWVLHWEIHRCYFLWLLLLVCCCFVHNPGPRADDAAALPPSPTPTLEGWMVGRCSATEIYPSPLLTFYFEKVSLSCPNSTWNLPWPLCLHLPST